MILEETFGPVGFLRKSFETMVDSTREIRSLTTSCMKMSEPMGEPKSWIPRGSVFGIPSPVGSGLFSYWLPTQMELFDLFRKRPLLGPLVEMISATFLRSSKLPIIVPSSMIHWLATRSGTSLLISSMSGWRPAPKRMLPTKLERRWPRKKRWEGVP